MVRSDHSGVSPKIQTAEDLRTFRELPKERLNQILCNSSEAVLNEIAKVMQGLCRHLNLTEAETAECTQKVKERNMGYLWENAEKMDIQLERRLRAEAEKKAEDAEKKAEDAEKRAEDAEERLEKKHEKMIRLLCGMGMDEQTARQKLEEMEVPDEES